jgi:hypothetical protein
MSLTPDSERNRNAEETAQDGRPLYWLVVILVLGLVVGWFYLQYGDLGAAWDEAGNWVFWIFLGLAWLMPLLAQLVQKIREAGGGDDVSVQGPKPPRRPGVLPSGATPDNKPIQPR